MRYVTTEFPVNLIPWDSLVGNGIERIKSYLEAYSENKEKFLPDGRGLYLWSTTPHNGKTTLALGLAKMIAAPEDAYAKEKMLVSRIGTEHNVAPTFAQVRFFDLVNRPTNAITDPSWLSDEMLLMRAHVLVIDGVSYKCVENLTQRNKFYNLLEARDKAGLTCIITADLPLQTKEGEFTVQSVFDNKIFGILQDKTLDIEVDLSIFSPPNNVSLRDMLLKGKQQP